MSENWIIIVLLVIVIPFFFWYRVKSINARKNIIHVRCPHCSKDQQILTLRNYTCKKCGEFIRFFDDEGTLLFTTKTYDCKACQERNPVGVLNCKGCGMGNPEGAPQKT